MPLKAGLYKKSIQAFGLRLPLDGHGAGHHPGRHHCFALARNSCRRTQILDTRIGARTNEHPVNGNRCQGCSWREPHVLQCRLHVITSLAYRKILRIRHHGINHGRLVEMGAPGHTGCDGCRIDGDFVVIVCVFITDQAFPIRHCLVPVSVLRRVLAAMQVVKGDLVRRHQAAQCPGLHRHIAQGHTPFHRHGANG